MEKKTEKEPVDGTKAVLFADRIEEMAVKSNLNNADLMMACCCCLSRVKLGLTSDEKMDPIHVECFNDNMGDLMDMFCELEEERP